MPTSKYRGEAEELLLCGIVLIPAVLIPVHIHYHSLLVLTQPCIHETQSAADFHPGYLLAWVCFALWQGDRAGVMWRGQQICSLANDIICAAPGPRETKSEFGEEAAEAPPHCPGQGKGVYGAWEP